MTAIHLDENTIQQYAITGVLAGEEQTKHFLHCNYCRGKAAAYKEVLTGIKGQPVPAFDFDLPALVMQKIPAKKAAIPWQSVLVIAGLLGLVSLVTYNLRAIFGVVFEGLSLTAASLIFIAVISVLIFQLADMVNKYHHQVNALD
jgi:hypothetical protein